MSFNYAARDYDTIKTDLLARAARTVPEWTDRDPSDFGMLLVDLWAMMGDTMHYYADKAASESFLQTATQRESVLAIAELFDYRPVGRASATGTVRVTNSDLVDDYIIEQDTEFLALANGEAYTLHAKDTTPVFANSFTDVVVGEGEIIDEEVLTDSASGLPGQKYSLRDLNAASPTVRVEVYEDGVNAVPYTFVPSLSKAAPGARVFGTHIGTDGAVEIDFGTAQNGFVPPTGATVVATYAACSGVAGNLPAGAALSFAIAPILPGVAVDTTNSSSPLSGGEDAESILSMKTSIPSAVSTQQRAVTRNDFVASALTIPGVAKAALQFTQGAGTDDNVATIHVQENRSDFLDVSIGTTQTVDVDLRALVEETIQERALLGVTVDTAATITWQPIDIAATVHVNRKAVTNTVDAGVVTALNELFRFENVKFGQLLHLGQIHRIILNVPGVDYVEVGKFSLGGGSGVANDILITPYQLPKKGVYALTFSGGISTS